VLFPFDARWIYYEREAKFLNEARPELGDHIVAGNEFLVGVPQARRVSESRPLILNSLFDLHLHDWGSVGFPAEVNADTEGIGGLFKPDPEELVPSANLAEATWTALRTAWKFKGDLRSKDAKRLCRALFRYCLAISHAPQYEVDHKEALSQDWPRIPIAKDKAAFDATAGLGERIASLLNPLADAIAAIKALIGAEAKALAVVHRVGGGNVKEKDLVVEYTYYGAATGRWVERPPADSEPLRPEWGHSTGDLYLNENVFLANVPSQVWRYEMGGYPVIKKWLGYRQANRRDNEPLTLQELDDLRGVVLRVAALLTLRPKLDAAYEQAAAACWSVEELSAEAPSTAGALTL
jgi:hypothetical protein